MQLSSHRRPLFFWSALLLLIAACEASNFPWENQSAAKRQRAQERDDQSSDDPLFSSSDGSSSNSGVAASAAAAALPDFNPSVDSVLRIPLQTSFQVGNSSGSNRNSASEDLRFNSGSGSLERDSSTLSPINSSILLSNSNSSTTSSSTNSADSSNSTFSIAPTDSSSTSSSSSSSSKSLLFPTASSFVNIISSPSSIGSSAPAIFQVRPIIVDPDVSSSISASPIRLTSALVEIVTQPTTTLPPKVPNATLVEGIYNYDGAQMVLVAFGTMSKNPDKLLTDSGDWAWAGAGTLNNAGKQESYNLGKYLRSRYGNLLPWDYDTDKVEAISSSDECAQAAMQTVLAGMFPPVGRSIWSNDVRWQPTSYKVDDETCGLPNIYCPTFDKIQHEVIDEESTEFATKMKQENQKVISYVANQTGWEPTLARLGDLAANVEQLKMNFRPPPSWVKSNPFDDKLFDEIGKFRNVKDVVCAEDPKCRKIVSGYYLKTLVDSIVDQSKQKEKVMKLSSSTQNSQIAAKMQQFYEESLAFVGLLWSLGVRQFTFPYGEALLVEFRSNPQPALRLLVSDPSGPTANDRTNYAVILEDCDLAEWCPLSKFLEIVRDHVTSDWRAECQAGYCPKKGKSGNLIIQDKVNLVISCEKELDQSGSFYCLDWAKHEYCTKYVSVRDFYCRKTCFCHDDFRQKTLALARRR